MIWRTAAPMRANRSRVRRDPADARDAQPGIELGLAGDLGVPLHELIPDPLDGVEFGGREDVFADGEGVQGHGSLVPVGGVILSRAGRRPPTGPENSVSPCGRAAS